ARLDHPAAGRRVAELNAIVKRIAQTRGVPLIDLNAALAPLPRQGLVADGIHLAAAHVGGAPHPCWFSDGALSSGMNVRNLVTLQALDRARRFLLEGEEPEQDLIAEADAYRRISSTS